MPTSFTIDFTAPNAPTNVTATPVKLLRAPDDDAVMITWLPVATAPENLVQQELWVTDGLKANRIAYWSDPAVHSYLYPFPPAKKNLLYRIHEVVRSGSSTLTGLHGIDAAQVNMQHLSLVSAVAPLTHRVAIAAWPNQRVTLNQQQDWHTPAGGTTMIELPGSLRSREINLSGQLWDRPDGVTADQSWQDLQDLFDTRETFCVRDPRGGKWFCRFLGDLTANYGKGGVRYELDFNVRKVAFVEGA
jgi:hypothetical protein